MIKVLILVNKTRVDWLTGFEGIDIVDGSGVFTHPIYKRCVNMGVLWELLSQHPDIVVVGDDRGVGGVVVREIPLKLRTRTIVVWGDDPSTADERPYLPLRVSDFGTRDQVADLVRAMIAEISAEGGSAPTTSE